MSKNNVVMKRKDNISSCRVSRPPAGLYLLGPRGGSAKGPTSEIGAEAKPFGFLTNRRGAVTDFCYPNRAIGPTSPPSHNTQYRSTSNLSLV